MKATITVDFNPAQAGKRFGIHARMTPSGRMMSGPIGTFVMPTRESRNNDEGIVTVGVVEGFAPEIMESFLDSQPHQGVLHVHGHGTIDVPVDYSPA